MTVGCRERWDWTSAQGCPGHWSCRTGPGPAEVVVGGADQANSSKGEEAFISDGGGRMDGKGGGWLAGSQIMPMLGKGRAC